MAPNEKTSLGDEAFTALVGRYYDRITAYVRRMVNDSTRAEDIVQETFTSALRSLRATDREIAAGPWLFQIARNACIDDYRRMKRTVEVSTDPAEFGSDLEARLHGPTTEATVTQRQDLGDLQQAFGELPDSHHRILLLRELEGLSYGEIGTRMRLTRPSVESMLSRARRSLKEHYDEIASGARCHRMGPVMAAVAGGRVGKRDHRTLECHIRYCRSCRRDAIASGVEHSPAMGS